MKGSGDDSGEIRTQRSALVQSTHIALAWEKVLSILTRAGGNALENGNANRRPQGGRKK